MSISPARVREIRELMGSEHRTHDQLDAVVDELLEDAERTPTDPTADLMRKVTDLTYAVRKAAEMLRGVVDADANGHPINGGLLLDVARELDEVVNSTR